MPQLGSSQTTTSRTDASQTTTSRTDASQTTACRTDASKKAASPDTARTPDTEATPAVVLLVTGIALLVPLYFADGVLAGPGTRLVLPVVTVGVFAAVTARPAATLAFTVIAAVLYDGFLVNRLGALSWSSTDVGRLAAFAAAGLVGLAISLTISLAIGIAVRRSPLLAAAGHPCRPLARNH
jgi:hypothetical protein